MVSCKSRCPVPCYSQKQKEKELPDKTFEEAAALAAYYSKGRDLEKVEVDYVLKKRLKTCRR